MKILLVRLRLIGDVIFTTPVVRAVRTRFPDAWIAYLVEPEAAPVVQDNPHLNQVIVAPRPTGWSRLSGDVGLALQLRDEHFDLAIDLHGGPRSSWLTWATRAPRRIGYDVLARSWMYTERVHRPRRLRPRHSVISQWDLLEPLGVGPPDPRRDPTEMRVEVSANARVVRRLADAGITSDHILIVMHVSAGNPFRRWPADAFAAAIGGLVSADERRRVLVTSGPSDRSARQQVIDRARQTLPADRTAQVVDCGELGLAELRAVLEHAALYVGGDSGPMHVASTSTVPIVAIYGPTLRERSEPWRDPSLVSEAVDAGALPCRPCNQRRCEPGDYRCLTRIDPHQVVVAAERALTHPRGTVAGLSSPTR